VGHRASPPSASPQAASAAQQSPKRAGGADAAEAARSGDDARATAAVAASSPWKLNLHISITGGTVISGDIEASASESVLSPPPVTAVVRGTVRPLACRWW
jgi:hypothetical protein